MLWKKAIKLIYWVGILRKILFYNKIVDNEVLTFHSVLTHVILQKLLNLIVLVHSYLFKTHIWSDEMDKFFRGDLTKSLESGNLWVWSQIFNSSSL